MYTQESCSEANIATVCTIRKPKEGIQMVIASTNDLFNWVRGKEEPIPLFATFPSNPFALVIKLNGASGQGVSNMGDYIRSFQEDLKKDLIRSDFIYDNSDYYDKVKKLIFESIPQEHITKANTILDYYSGKYASLRLTGVQMSSFRKRVCELTASFARGDYTISEEDIGLLCSLLSFHAFDTHQEEVLLGRNQNVERRWGGTIKVTMHSYMPIKIGKNNSVVYYMISDLNECFSIKVPLTDKLKETMDFFTDNKMSFVIKNDSYTDGSGHIIPHNPLVTFTILEILN